MFYKLVSLLSFILPFHQNINRVYTSLLKFFLSLHLISILMCNKLMKRGALLCMCTYILYASILQPEREKKTDTHIHRPNWDGMDRVEMKCPFRKRNMHHGLDGTLNSFLQTEELGPNLWLFCHLRQDMKEMWSDHTADGLDDQLSENNFMKSTYHMFSVRWRPYFVIQTHTNIHMCVRISGSGCHKLYSLC